MVASIFPLGSASNTILRYHFSQQLLMINKHCTNVFIIGWEVHNYRSMMASIFPLSLTVLLLYIDFTHCCIAIAYDKHMFIIGWELNNYKSMTASILVLCALLFLDTTLLNNCL